LRQTGEFCDKSDLRNKAEPDDGGTSGVPKRQAGGLRSGVRIVSTFDNFDN
jgi:hypothetical protein